MAMASGDAPGVPTLWELCLRVSNGAEDAHSIDVHNAMHSREDPELTTPPPPPPLYQAASAADYWRVQRNQLAVSSH